VKRDYDLFLEKMKSLGYTLIKSNNPADLKKETEFRRAARHPCHSN